MPDHAFVKQELALAEHFVILGGSFMMQQLIQAKPLDQHSLHPLQHAIAEKDDQSLSDLRAANPGGSIRAGWQSRDGQSLRGAWTIRRGAGR
jgi:hypothetical protein